MKDGWHTICGMTVYIEGNCVMRGIATDYNGHDVPGSPFRATFYRDWMGQQHQKGWINCTGISASAFAAAARRGYAAVK